MNATITYIHTGSTYTVTCDEDCRGVDIHAYQMFTMLGRTVLMGSVLVEAAEAIWEMPDYSTTPDAVDQYFQDMEIEMQAQDAQDEQDWHTTVRDHS